MLFGYQVDRNDAHPPPVVTCPDDFIAWLKDGEYIVPDFSSAITINGLCQVDSEFTVTQQPPAGTVLTIGGHVIILIVVIDGHANEVTCSFQIDVHDPNDPDTDDPPTVLPPWIYAPYLLFYYSANDTQCTVGSLDEAPPCWFRRDLSEFFGNSPHHLSNGGDAVLARSESFVRGFTPGPIFSRGSMWANMLFNAFLYHADAAALRLLNTDFTVRMAFKLVSLDNGGSWNLVGKYDTVGWRLKIVRSGSEYRLSPELRNGSSSVTTTYRLISLGTWIYAAMTFNSALGRLRLYVDGQQVEETISAGFALSGEVSQFRIGQPATGIGVGALVCWNMNTTDWLDSVNGYALTPSGSPSLIAGKINDAARLTGAANLFVADAAPLRLNGTDFTIRLWIRLTASPPAATGGPYIKKWGSNTGWFFGCYSDDGVAVKVRHGINNQIVIGAVAHTVGVWQHIVITWNNSTNTLTQYIDNVSVFSDGSFVSPDASAAHDLVIERPFADMDIDEVAIWNRILSGAEIAADYNAGAGTSCPASTSAATCYHDEIGCWLQEWSAAQVASDYAIMTALA